MTDGDRKFLMMLASSHKRAISEECARKKLDKSGYFRRAARVDRKVREIEQSFSRPRRF